MSEAAAPTEIQKATYEQVSTWMQEMFGEFATARPETQSVSARVGSAVVFVYVTPWGDKDAVIHASSLVAIGSETSPDLMKFLLERNTEMRFGAFGMDEQGRIFFRHSIVGSSASKEELRASVLAVAFTADDFDDTIVSRWGGQRYTD